MAKEPTKTKSEGDVPPLFALHKVVYGERRVAQPNSIFQPVSKKERDDLLSLEAARDLTDDEVVLAKELDLAPAPADDKVSISGDEIA